MVIQFDKYIFFFNLKTKIKLTILFSIRINTIELSFIYSTKSYNKKIHKFI